MAPESWHHVQFNTTVTWFVQPSVAGYVTVPLLCQGIRRRRDKVYNHEEDPPCRMHRVNPDEVEEYNL